MKKPLQPPLIRIIDDDAQALEAVDFMLKCEGYSTRVCHLSRRPTNG